MSKVWLKVANGGAIEVEDEPDVYALPPSDPSTSLTVGAFTVGAGALGSTVGASTATRLFHSANFAPEAQRFNTLLNYLLKRHAQTWANLVASVPPEYPLFATSPKATWRVKATVHYKSAPAPRIFYDPLPDA